MEREKSNPDTSPLPTTTTTAPAVLDAGGQAQTRLRRATAP
jgi:hypothetical protein